MNWLATKNRKMECDQSLKPLSDHSQCGNATLRVKRIVTGVITDVMAHRDGWQIEGRADQHGQMCQFLATGENTVNVRPGMRFELEGNIIKIFAPVE